MRRTILCLALLLIPSVAFAGSAGSWFRAYKQTITGTQVETSVVPGYQFNEYRIVSSCIANDLLTITIYQTNDADVTIDIYLMASATGEIDLSFNVPTDSLHIHNQLTTSTRTTVLIRK
jgi:hypothetical protein